MFETADAFAAVGKIGKRDAFAFPIRNAFYLAFKSTAFVQFRQNDPNFDGYPLSFKFIDDPAVMNVSVLAESKGSVALPFADVEGKVRVWPPMLVDVE